jgi:hypothetical protein
LFIAAPALLAFGASGCAAQLAERNQLANELDQARGETAAEHARVTELEARMVVIERELANSKRAQVTRDTPVLAKLDQLIRVNEKALQRAQPEPPKAVTAPDPAALQSTMSSGWESPPAEDRCGDELDPAEQIERLVRRLHGARGSSWRGGLSLEQSQALRVLLRRDRELDRNSPWQD